MTIPMLKKPLSGRPYLAGMLFWVVFSLIAVLVRGVRWDENFEFAQVILGQVPYPEGHPLVQYVRSFLSLQTYALAAFMHFFPDPLPANLLRNWAFLATSTVPVFLLGTLFSHRQLAGHVAAVFVLLEVHTSFYSSYPIHVWPGVFSNGPVGMGYMLFTLWALLDRRYRLAGALLGLAPAVHLGQLPPLLAVSVLYGFHLHRSGERGDTRRLVLFALPGLVFSIGFAVLLHRYAGAPPTSGPYFSAVAPAELWHTYMAKYATHRAIPYTTGHLVLVAVSLLALYLYVFQRAGIIPAREGEESVSWPASPRAWGLLYCLICAGLVWGIMVVHTVMGADVPYLLAGWLPYRLMNHVSPVFIPLLLALGYDRDERVPVFLPVLLLLALLAPLLHLWVERDYMVRYVNANAYLYFLLVGAVAGTGVVVAFRAGRTAGLATLGSLSVLVALLAYFHQYGAACVAMGMILGWAPATARISRRVLRVSVVGLACLVLTSMLAAAREAREHLPRSAFHREVAAYLAACGEPGAMILVPYMQVGDQMKYGHPVMADMATMFHGAYRPAIAPAVSAVFQDFYGLSLDPAWLAAHLPMAWYEVWPSKTLEEWQALGEKYGLRYVASPTFMELPLEQVLARPGGRLYRIPRSEPVLSE
jgi:hypothetical protein